MYSKSGSVQKAEELFEKLEARTTVSWTALIVGYADNGYPEEALLCLDRMQGEEGISADAPLYMCSLKACGCVGALGKGQEIHVEICKSGFERDMQISSTLVDMYAKNGSLAEASCLFHKHRDGDVVLWTSLIAGYAEHEQSEEAIRLFAQMQHCAISPDSVTFSFALKACGTMGAHGKGRQIHAIAAIGGMESDLLFGNSLIDMYVKCGMIANAHEALHELSARDVASWTALMVGFVEHDLNREALDCFEKMQDDGISPDEVAYSCALKACESSRTISKAADLHSEVVVKGYEDLAIASTLLGIYVRHGLLVEALGVFDSLQARNVVLWNALIGGFVEHGLSENALDCLPKMQREGVSPHQVTFLCVLKACGSLGATDLGKELHSDVMERGFEADLTIGNTLVDLYAKCGMLLEAKDVFEKLPDQDEVSWNTLLVGYSQIGESELVFNFFKRMLGSGWKPNTVALVSILNVCNHAGKLDEGHLYFGAMCHEYGMIPTPEHHTCLVDLLGRAGLVDSAMLLIKEMPYHPSVTPWHTILGACRKWGNVELGIHAFEEAIGLSDTDVSAYISMGNIFADAEMRIPGLC
jgi:pentatricopeptide repeat protein